MARNTAHIFTFGFHCFLLSLSVTNYSHSQPSSWPVCVGFPKSVTKTFISQGPELFVMQVSQTRAAVCVYSHLKENKGLSSCTHVFHCPTPSYVYPCHVKAVHLLLHIRSIITPRWELLLLLVPVPKEFRVCLWQQQFIFQWHPCQILWQVSSFLGYQNLQHFRDQFYKTGA